jgi:hypothetical protein
MELYMFSYLISCKSLGYYPEAILYCSDLLQCVKLAFYYFFRLCAALVVVHLSSFYCKHVVYIYNEEDKSVQQPKLLVEGEMYTKMPDYWQGYVLSFRPNFQIS